MKKTLKKIRIWSLLLSIVCMISAVSFAEEATLRYSYGNEAFNKHMLDIQNATTYGGAKWVFEQGAFSFEGDFVMHGGNTRTVYECKVPEFRWMGANAEQKLYLGKVEIRPTEKMDLHVFSGDRTTGNYVLTDSRKNIGSYTLDIFAARDENGTLRLTDKVFLYTYHQNGLKKNYAASLYISFENYEAAPADTLPENAVIDGEIAREETQNTNSGADNGKLENYASMITILEAENEALLDQIAQLQAQVSEETQSDAENLMAEISVTATPETVYLTANKEKSDAWLGWDVTFSIQNVSNIPFTPECAIATFYNGETVTERLVITYEQLRQHMGNDALIKGNDPLEWGFGWSELNNTHVTFAVQGTDSNGLQVEAEATALLVNVTEENARLLAQASKENESDEVVQELRMLIEEQAAELEVYQNNINQLFAENVALKARLNAASANTADSELEAIIEKQEEELENCYKDIEQLIQDNTELIEKVKAADSLQNTLETLEKKVKEQETELETCYSDIEKLIADNTALIAQVKNAEGMKETIAELNQVIEDKNETLEGCFEMLDRLNNDLANLKAEAEKGSRLLRDPETEVSSLGKEQSVQPVKSEAVQYAVDDDGVTITQIVTNKTSLPEDEKKIAEQAGYIGQLETDIDALKAQIVEMEAAIEQMNADKASLEAEPTVEADYSAMSLEELNALNAQNAQNLLAINTVLGKRAKENALQKPAEGSLGAIKDLFPDEILACYVRDQLSKFSIEQTVTQEELDKITRVYFWATNEYPRDLTGIGHLRNLQNCTVANYYGKFIPDDMQKCTQLETIYFLNSSVEAIPEWIGDLVMLKRIEINRGTIREIPESIGKLVRLESLTLENNDIEVVPASIANCIALKTLDLENNNISVIPDSMWSMQFDTLVLSGNPIR